MTTNEAAITVAGLRDMCVSKINKEALNMAIEALNKQKPKQCLDVDEADAIYYRCPECWYVTDWACSYCPQCGQRLVTKEDLDV